jgi:hypothetical protein
MPWTHAGSAVVVVAQQFNPSIVTQMWLVRHGVLADEDFQEGSLHSDFIVQVRSRLFHMLVLPEQLQFVPLGPPDDHQRLIVEKIGMIVRTLPETPYRAVGLNFNWHLTPADGNIARLTRDLFYCRDRPLDRRFAADDANYGGYLSKNFAGFRFKLDIKPILVPLVTGPENRLQFFFNFHCDLGEEAAAEIQQRLLHWDEVRREAEQVIDSVEARQP